MSAFPFDVGFQRATLRLMMVDDSFAVKAMEWLEPGHFTEEAFGWVFLSIQKYWQSYQSRMTDVVLRDCVRQLPADRQARFAAEAEGIIGFGVVPEDGYIRAKLADFVKQALFATAHQRSAELFNAGKQAEAYDVTMRALERIQTIDFGNVDRIWLFDELDARQLLRIRAQLNPGTGVITTGLPELDEATDGGIHLGEVLAVLAYAKRCKTTWLVNQLFHATRIHRVPALYLNLEGKGRMIANRLDSCFSRELYTKVKRGEIDPHRYRILAEEYASLRGLAVIRSLNDWDITILNVQAELQYLKGQGFVPQMLVVDYMDIGRARDKVQTETQHQVSFARDLKRLVNNNDMACWSAWQAQRPAKAAHTRKHVLRSSNAADAYAKVRIVDGFGSLNATDAEMREGKMRIYWEEHRDAAVNKLWEVTNELAHMRMVTSAVEVLPDDNESSEES